MDEIKCICGNKLEFVSRICEADEIWKCKKCGEEYIYNASDKSLYGKNNSNCC